MASKRRAAPPPPTEFKVGDSVDAFWEEDNEWFDGLIESLSLEEGTIRVKYVDYNESYDVPVDWVQAKKISASLAAAAATTDSVGSSSRGSLPPVPPAPKVSSGRRRAQTDTRSFEEQMRSPPASVRKARAAAAREDRTTNVNRGSFARELMSKSQRMQNPDLSVTSRKQAQEHQEIRVMAAEAGEWMSRLLGKKVCDLNVADVAADLVSNLGTGIELCLLVHRLCEKQRTDIAKKCKFSVLATKGSFKARDNIHNFLEAAEAIGVPRLSLFESEDIVKERHHRRIVDCLLKCARLGADLGVEPPTIVKMELEVDRSVAEAPAKQTEKLGPMPTTKLAKSKHATDREIAALIREKGLRNIDICRVPDRDDFYYVSVTGELNKNAIMVAIRKIRSTLLVRVGGGWLDFVEFVERRLRDLPRQIGVNRSMSGKSIKVTKNISMVPTKKDKVIQVRKSSGKKSRPTSGSSARSPANGVGRKSKRGSGPSAAAKVKKRT